MIARHAEKIKNHPAVKDREAITDIREYYSAQSDADALRIALPDLLRTLKKEERREPPQA